MNFHDDLQGLENWTTRHNVIEEIKKMGLAINFDATPFREVMYTNGKSIVNVIQKNHFFIL